MNLRKEYPQVPPKVEYALPNWANLCARSSSPWNCGDWIIKAEHQ